MATPKTSRTRPKSKTRAKRKPKLLASGNPQIAKAYGAAPVKAYIAAMPGWKRAIGRRVDAIVDRVVPGVEKAVKWNTPFYGTERDRWFLGVHCYAKYVQLTFFRGSQLEPPPAKTSKYPDVRYFDIREDAPLDEAQLEDWIRQASKLPGEKL